MTVRTSTERRRADEDQPKVDKETVKDLEPSETDEVQGGAAVGNTVYGGCSI